MTKTRKLVFAISLSILALPVGRIYAAGEMDAAPENANPAVWNLSYSPVSQNFASQLVGFAQTDAGANLIALAPDLAILRNLNPKSEAHRRIIGALGLPANFEKQLSAVKRSRDKAALNAVGVTIMNAYNNQDFHGKITEATEDRADAIIKAISEHRLSKTQIFAAADEIAPLASFSKNAQTIVLVAANVRKQQSDKAMDEARHWSSILMATSGSATGNTLLSTLAASNLILKPTTPKIAVVKDGKVSEATQGEQLQPHTDSDETAPTTDVPSAPQSAASVAQNPSAANGTIDVATLYMILTSIKRHPSASISKAVELYTGSYKDVALARKYDGQELTARGILEVESRSTPDEVIVSRYLKAGNGSQILLNTREFSPSIFDPGEYSYLISARNYRDSQPNGKSVIVSFKIQSASFLSSIFGGRATFKINKITPADKTDEMMDVATMEKLENGFNTIRAGEGRGVRVHVGPGALDNAALLRQYEGKKLQARGIFEAVSFGTHGEVTVSRYLNGSDGSRIFLDRQKFFPSLTNLSETSYLIRARSYFNSQPNRKEVVLDFKAKLPYFGNTKVFNIQKITLADEYVNPKPASRWARLSKAAWKMYWGVEVAGVSYLAAMFDVSVFGSTTDPHYAALFFAIFAGAIAGMFYAGKLLTDGLSQILSHIKITWKE